MRNRGWKYTAIILSCGTVLQVGACLPVIGEIILQNVLAQVLVGVLDGITGSNDNTNANDNS